MAELYYDAQRYDAAIALYEKQGLKKLTEKELVHYAQSVLLLGNYKKALEVATEGSEFYPTIQTLCDSCSIVIPT